MSRAFVVFINQVGADSEVDDIGGKREIRRWPDAVVEYGGVIMFSERECRLRQRHRMLRQRGQINIRLEGLWPSRRVKKL